MLSLPAVSVSRSVRQGLSATPHPLRVLGVFDDASNLATADGRVVALVTRSIGDGSLNIVVGARLPRSLLPPAGAPFVLVNDHPEHILGYIRMEADLLPKGNSGRIAGYIQKPQWLLFQSRFIARFMMQDPGWFIDMIYPSRMTSPFKQVDRDYLAYEFSRPEVSDQVPNYFLKKNWDLDTAIGKICRNNFPFAVLQLQADSDPAQPKSIFADAAKECPNVTIEWVTNASHFSNFDQPQQVADAINRFVHSTSR